MTCDEVLIRLDAWVDGGLHHSEQEGLAAHLAGCSNCRAEAEALRALLGQARTLPRAIPPERDLWTGIAARLEAPGGPPHQQEVTQSRSGRLASRRLLLAAAVGGILLGIAIASLWYRQGPQREFAVERARYTEASAALARTLAAHPGSLTPETKAVVERTLSILDQAIAEAEMALANDRNNVELEQMLLARYEQRLGLLRRAAAAGRSVT